MNSTPFHYYTITPSVSAMPASQPLYCPLDLFTRSLPSNRAVRLFRVVVVFLSSVLLARGVCVVSRIQRVFQLLPLRLHTPWQAGDLPAAERLER